MIRDIEFLRNSRLTEIKCHNSNTRLTPCKSPTYFCPDCMSTSKGNKYFLCDDCEYYEHSKSHKKLHRPIQFNTRIDLKREFNEHSNKKEENNIHILMSQSPGRAAFINTGFYIMQHFDTIYKNLISNIVNTDINKTKHIESQINNLNHVTNIINLKSTRKIHQNNKDTDFRIYPRVNTEFHPTIKKNKQKRYIPGPLNINLNFDTHYSKNQINGNNWPLGVYNLDMNPDIFDLLFKDKEKSDTFFNVINKTNHKNYANKLSHFKKGLLLELDTLTEEQQKNIKKRDSYSLIHDLLDLNSESEPHDKYTINRYNKYLFENLFYKNKILNTQVKIRDIIKHVIEYNKQSPEYRPEQKIVFIVNQCRTIHMETNNIPLANNLNQTKEPRTKPLFNSMREDSDRAV